MTSALKTRQAVDRAEHKWLALWVLACGLAMIVLDATIVGVALPTIIQDLALSLPEAEWVNALYAVVFAALLMSFGTLGDLVGRRKLFVIGVVLFAASSVLAAAAQTSGALILARAIQGIGGAMVLPSSLSSVNAAFRGPDRAAAFGIWGAVMATAAAIGPLLGGWLTSTLSWRWIFWVNIPVGVLVVLGAWRFVVETRGQVQRGGFDWVGLVLSCLGFGALVFALIEGPRFGWWVPETGFHLGPLSWPANAPVSPIPILGGLGLTLILAFVGWQRIRIARHRLVILDLGLFRVATFSWGNITAFSVAAGEFALVFALPLYLVGVLGLSAMGAGWVLATMAAGAFIAGAGARFLAVKLGPARVVILGLVLELVGVVVTACLLGTVTRPWALAATLGCYGLGLGLAAAQLTSLVLRDVPQERSGQASATQSTLRQVGSAVGTALAGTTMAAGLAHFLTRALGQVPGVTSEQGGELVGATIASVGGNLGQLRAAAAAGQLGPAGEQVVTALARGFTQAAALSVWVAAAFLVLGLVGSFRVAQVAGPGDAE